MYVRGDDERNGPVAVVRALNVPAHQFVELGEACRETGRTERAAECFQRALQKDPQHMPALWGRTPTSEGRAPQGRSGG